MKRPLRTPGLLGWIDRFAQFQNNRRSRGRARRHRGAYADDATSGVHNSGGLTTLDELDAAGMRNGTFYLGADETGEAIFINTEGSCLSIGLPGVGKGATIVQSNLGWIGNEYSVVAIDIGNENFRVSAVYRHEELGQQVFANNPSGSYNIESVNIDMLSHIREAGRRGNFKLTERYAREFKHILIPDKGGKGDDAHWIVEAARGIAQWVLVWTALEMPHLCNLPSIYDLVSMPPRELLQFVLENTRLEYVTRRVSVLIADLEAEADKQLHWKFEKIQEALEPYQRGTELGDSLAGEPFDPVIMRHRPTTLYLQIPESSLEAYAPYVGMILTSLVEQLSDVDGPQKLLFLCDEFNQLPKLPVERWIRTLRRRKIQFWLFIQSFAGLEGKYGKAGLNDIVDSCHVVQHLSVGPETAKRLSERAGFRTVFGRSMNQGGDGRTASDGMSEQRQSVLPVADVLNMPRNAQFIEIKGMKLIKGLRFPWWEIEPLCDRLKHFSKMEDQPRYRRANENPPRADDDDE
jgi:type IV secretory pathway TraG/TraD family ATPase VirD4